MAKLPISLLLVFVPLIKLFIISNPEVKLSISPVLVFAPLIKYYLLHLIPGHNYKGTALLVFFDKLFHPLFKLFNLEVVYVAKLFIPAFKLLSPLFAPVVKLLTPVHKLFKLLLKLFKLLTPAPILRSNPAFAHFDKLFKPDCKLFNSVFTPVVKIFILFHHFLNQSQYY